MEADLVPGYVARSAGEMSPQARRALALGEVHQDRQLLRDYLRHNHGRWSHHFDGRGGLVSERLR